MTLLLQPGQTYGAYTVKSIVGQGSFARVYVVETPGYPDPLALKLSVSPIVAPDMAARAMREVRILRKLTNPHVVRVHDAGLDREGHAYVLMDYAQGWPLNVAHDFDKPSRIDRAMKVVWQICTGVGEAHELGIVHRDLKPENVILDEKLEAKVVDFGFARSFADGTVVGNNVTSADVLVGTPHYAQPEQVHSHTLTPAADVYSIAIITYELLTGHTPFDADATVSEVKTRWMDNVVAWIQAHAQSPVVPLREHAATANLPAGFAAVIETALSKDPTQRPPTAHAFMQGLAHAWQTARREGSGLNRNPVPPTSRPPSGPARI